MMESHKSVSDLSELTSRVYAEEREVTCLCVPSNRNCVKKKIENKEREKKKERMKCKLFYHIHYGWGRIKCDMIDFVGR